MSIKTNHLSGLAIKFEYTNVALIWFFPVSYLAVLLGHLLLIEKGASQPKLHLFALIISCSVWLAFWLINIIIHKAANPIRAIIKLIAVIFIGGARGAEIYYLGIYLQLDSGVSLNYRIWNSILTTLVWLGLFSYVINRQREFQARYRSLISKSIRERSSGISETELTNYLTQIEQSLKAIKFDNSHPEQLAGAAQEVKTQIDQLIRPLSKRLWLDSIAGYPKIKFTKVLRDAVIELQVAVLPLSAFFLATSIVNLSSVISFTEATSRSLVNLAVGLAIYYGLKNVKFNKLAFDLSFSGFKLILFTALPSLVSEYLHSIVLFNNPSSITIFALLPFPVLLVVFSVIRIIDADRNYLVEILNRELLSPNPSYQKSQVASYLHNSLQSELLAMANQLEHAATKSDPDHAKATLEQLGALINRSVSDDFRNLYASPEKRLNQVIANWRGILEINITNSDLIFALPNKAVIAVQLIEELASNAIKHSAESRLEITCEVIGSKLILKTAAFANDLKSAPGMGTALMQSYLNDQAQSLDQIQFEI